MAKKRKIAPRIRHGKHDAITNNIANDYMHQNSAVISSRSRVLQFELGEVESSIVALSAALVQAKDRRARIDATLKGLAKVAATRGSV